MATVIDNYSETNQDSVFTFGASTGGAFGANIEIGQCFTGNGGKIVDARFYLRKRVSPTGNIVAKIYTMTGTFGVNGDVGTLLATSDNFNASTLPSSFALVTFTFTGAQQFITTNGAHYVVTLRYDSTPTPANTVDLGYDGSSGTHPGTWTYFDTSWHPTDGGIDLVFYVDGVSDVSVNLTGVGATPVLGEGTVTIGSAAVTPPDQGLVAGGGHWFGLPEDEKVYLTGVAADPQVGRMTPVSGVTREKVAEMYRFPGLLEARPVTRLVARKKVPPTPLFVYPVRVPGARAAVGSVTMKAFYEDIDEETIAMIDLL